MTTHQNGDLCFECDECGVYKEFPEGADFVESWNELKADEGWRCTKKSGKWQHFCRRCVIDWAREQSDTGDNTDPDEPF